MPLPPFASRRLAALAALCAAAALPAAAAETFETSAGSVQVEEIADGLEHPWGLAFLPDGALLVTERPGRLVLIRDGVKTRVAGAPEVWARGQGGMLDVVASPDFAETGQIFLTYSEPAPEGGAQTAAMRARLVFDPAPRLAESAVIFRQEPTLSGGRHFGSRIVIADDGTLWITTGDRGERRRAQDMDGHVGKVIRIRPDGSIPDDNPHLGEAGVKPEIWSTGHRNPQGAAKHPETGALWTAEHGARGGDEINLPEAGRNYGWPRISYGTHYSGASIGEGQAAEGLEQPLFYWDPSIAPSGLAFYDGDLFPEWRGDLFAGALKFRLISRLDVENGEIVGEERLFADEFGRIRDVRSGPDGALWFITDSRDGGVYRVTPAG